MMKKLRQSNLELLRIVSMLLIVMCHCDDIFGLANLYSRSLGVNKIITDWLHIGGQIGVGCFILISGYFMVEQTISTKKLLKLAGEVWFYTIGIWLIWVTQEVFRGKINAKLFLLSAKDAFFPILTSRYWFITAYMILMVLSPFFNKYIHSLNRQQYQALLGTLLTVFVIIGGGIPSVLTGMYEGRLIPVFIMYFVAGYIRRFGDLSKKNSSRHFTVAAVLYSLLFASFYLITFMGRTLDSKIIMDQRYFYRSLKSPFVVVICIELFVGFLKLDIGNNRLINTLASCTLGVYLLHCNNLMRGYLSKLFPIYRENRSVFIFVYSLFSVLIIYAITSFIDYIRQKSVEKLWIDFLENHLETIEGRIRERIIKMLYFFRRTLKTYYNKS